jgi:hypothetical protein
MRKPFVFPPESPSRFSLKLHSSSALSAIRDHPGIPFAFARKPRRGPIKMNFASYGRRAAAVRLVHYDLELVEAQRLSRWTVLRHPPGGFVGVAAYEGELREFVRLLQAA